MGCSPGPSLLSWGIPSHTHMSGAEFSDLANILHMRVLLCIFLPGVLPPLLSPGGLSPWPPSGPPIPMCHPSCSSIPLPTPWALTLASGSGCPPVPSFLQRVVSIFLRSRCSPAPCFPPTPAASTSILPPPGLCARLGRSLSSRTSEAHRPSSPACRERLQLLAGDNNSLFPKQDESYCCPTFQCSVSYFYHWLLLTALVKCLIPGIFEFGSFELLCNTSHLRSLMTNEFRLGLSVCADGLSPGSLYPLA